MKFLMQNIEGVFDRIDPSWRSDNYDILRYGRDMNKRLEKLFGRMGLVAFTRSMSGPEVEFVRRALRQLEQAGEIMWDDPEDEWEITAEQPFLDIQEERRAYDERARIRTEQARKSSETYRAKLKRFQITKEHLENITSPTYRFPHAGDNLKTLMCSVPDIPFCFTDFGLDFGYGQNRMIANSMIRHGLVEVLEEYDDPLMCLFQRGINYERFMNHFNLKYDPKSLTTRTVMWCAQSRIRANKSGA